MRRDARATPGRIGRGLRLVALSLMLVPAALAGERPTGLETTFQNPPSPPLSPTSRQKLEIYGQNLKSEINRLERSGDPADLRRLGTLRGELSRIERARRAGSPGAAPRVRPSPLQRH